MKNTIVTRGFLLLASLLTVAGCTEPNYFTDDNYLSLSISGDNLRILQVTDLHLTYGIDYNDRHTLKLIKELNDKTNPDLIVITGDISMSPLGPSLFTKLISYMEDLDTPWTFVFGNHETDFDDYKEFLEKIHDTKNLLFKVGPTFDDTKSYGNFRIQVEKNGNPFRQLYFLDSHTENDTESGYGYITEDQTNWFHNHLVEDQLTALRSLAFMHIPLQQYTDYSNHPLIDGAMEEGIICYQGIDTGFYDEMVNFGLTDGVFVGHDHNNNFSFLKDNILLAYGQTTGYNGYGFLDRGGRVIDISSTGALSSYNITEAEL